MKNYFIEFHNKFANMSEVKQFLFDWQNKIENGYIGKYDLEFPNNKLDFFIKIFDRDGKLIEMKLKPVVLLDFIDEEAIDGNGDKHHFDTVYYKIKK